MGDDEDLLAEFRELSRTRRLKCGVSLALNQLQPADRKKLLLALDADGIHHTAIMRWLERRGVSLSKATVGRHRNAECACRRYD